METIKNERVAIFFSYLKDKKKVRNQQDFTERIGTDKTTMSQILNKKTTLSNKMSNKICDAFPEINPVWLESGEGDMLKTPGFEDVPDSEILHLHPKPGDDVIMVPLINIDSVGGMLSTNDIAWYQQYIIRHIPFIDAREDDIAIYQSGDSMSPGIPSGSILHLRQVHGWEEYFGYGDTFVLWLKDDRRITKQVLKYIPDPKNYVTCHSFNPEYADEELPKKYIRQVWKIITILSDKGW